MKKRLLVLFLAVTLLCSCTGTPTHSANATAKVVAPAFSGYVCGMEDTETFLQFPILIPEDVELDNSAIRRVVLSGKDVEVETSSPHLFGQTESGVSGYVLATLSFQAKLSASGTYTINKVSIELWEGEAERKEGETIVLDLNDLVFEVQPAAATEAELLSNYQFFISSGDLPQLRVTYQNHTDQPITIKGFSYPEDVCTGYTVQKYTDFDTSTAEDGMDVPANSQKTFVVHFNFTQDFLKTDGMFYLFLPFVEYEAAGTTYTMPAQNQSIVVHPALTADVIQSIVN